MKKLYRVTLGEAPIVTVHLIKRETKRQYIDMEDRTWHKVLLKDYRWFPTYLKALQFLENEYKMRKYMAEVELESSCENLKDVQNEIQQISTQLPSEEDSSS